MQLEWLKKSWPALGTEERRRMIEPAQPRLPVTQQCALLGWPRSSYYHRGQPESDENGRLLRVIRRNVSGPSVLWLAPDDAVAPAPGPTE